MSGLDACDFDFGLGETLDEVRAHGAPLRRAPRSRRSPPRSTATTQFPAAAVAQAGRRRACSASPCRSARAAPDLGYLAHVVAMEEISPRLGLGRPLLRRPLQPLREPAAPATAATRSSAATCRSWSAASTSARWRCREPGAGSDVVSMQLRAERAATATSSTARKMWITNGPDADVLVVYAKTEPDGRRARHHRLHRREGLPGLLAPRRSSTSSACAAPTPASWCSRTAGCRPRTCSASVDGGVRVLMSGLDYERAVLAGGPLGIMAGRARLGAALRARAAAVRRSRSARSS